MRQLHKLITYKKANPTLTQSLPRHDALSNAVCVQHLYLPRPLTPVLHFPVVLVLVLAPEGAKAATALAASDRRTACFSANSCAMPLPQTSENQGNVEEDMILRLCISVF